MLERYIDCGSGEWSQTDAEGIGKRPRTGEAMRRDSESASLWKETDLKTWEKENNAREETEKNSKRDKKPVQKGGSRTLGETKGQRGQSTKTFDRGANAGRDDINRNRGGDTGPAAASVPALVGGGWGKTVRQVPVRSRKEFLMGRKKKKRKVLPKGQSPGAHRNPLNQWEGGRKRGAKRELEKFSRFLRGGVYRGGNEVKNSEAQARREQKKLNTSKNFHRMTNINCLGKVGLKRLCRKCRQMTIRESIEVGKFLKGRLEGIPNKRGKRGVEGS